MLRASGKGGVGTMKMRQGSRSPFVLCVVVQTVIFGLGNVITKFAYESVTPLCAWRSATSRATWRSM